MFGRLAYAGELVFLDSASVEEVVEGEGEAALEGGARAQARSEGHVSGEDGVEASDRSSALDYLAGYAEDIARPLLGRGVGFFESEAYGLVDVDREEVHAIGGVGADSSQEHLVDGAREDESAVIVGVFADKVDASGRSVESGVAAEFFGEDFLDFFLKSHGV